MDMDEMNAVWLVISRRGKCTGRSDSCLPRFWGGGEFRLEIKAISSLKEVYNLRSVFISGQIMRVPPGLMFGSRFGDRLEATNLQLLFLDQDKSDQGNFSAEILTYRHNSILKRE